MWTLTCQKETPVFLLGLVVEYPPWFFDSDDFFHFWTLWVLSGLCFFKSAWWCFYHSTTSKTAGFIGTVGLLKWLVVHFLWGLDFYILLYPCWFYTACGFHNITRDVFILSAASIWQGRVIHKKGAIKKWTALLQCKFLRPTWAHWDLPYTNFKAFRLLIWSYLWVNI